MAAISKKQTSQLEKLYYSPKTGFNGAKQLQKLSGLPMKVIRQFLTNQRVYSLHAPSRKTFPRLGLSIAAKLYKQAGIDLICWPSLAEYNNGVKYILILMCALSKRAHARPLKTRSTGDVKKALTQILESEIAPHKVKFLHGDREGSFVSNDLQNYLKKTYNIKIFATSTGDTKCFLVERLILTIKRMLSRYMTHFNTYKYTNVLQQIIDNYNNTVHSTTKLSPNEIFQNDPALTELAYANMELSQMKRISKNYNNRSIRQGRPRPKFKIGDYVRVSFARAPFSKSYTANFSERIYIITNVIDKGLLYVYRIKDPYDRQDATDNNIDGVFYSHELIKAFKPQKFIIQDILDVKRIGKHIFALTHWLGYNRKSDHTWRKLSKQEIGSLKHTHLDLWNKL